MVCRSVTLVSPAKMAEPMEMPFGSRTRVGPRNHVLDGGPDPPMGRGNFEGKVMPADLSPLAAANEHWARPPVALWWHYRPRGTSEFVIMRGAMRPFVKLLWPLVCIVVSPKMYIIFCGLVWLQHLIFWDVHLCSDILSLSFFIFWHKCIFRWFLQCH